MTPPKGTPSPGSGRHTREEAKRLRLADRRALAWSLYKAGNSYAEVARLIAAEHGIHVDRTTIGDDIRHVLRQYDGMITADEVSRHRTLQLERIQDAVRGIWTKVCGGDLGAISAMIRLLEREARLLGLDAPAKVDISARLQALAESEGVSAEEALAAADRILHQGRLGG